MVGKCVSSILIGSFNLGYQLIYRVTLYCKNEATSGFALVLVGYEIGYLASLRPSINPYSTHVIAGH